MNERYLIAAAVRRWHPPRLWAVCDNVSWGLDLDHEADAICISKTGIVHELEAKSTRHDLKRDLKKQRWKRKWVNPSLDFFWYVVPEKLEGLAIQQARSFGHGVVVVRKPEKHMVLGDAVRVLQAKRMRPRDYDRQRDKRPRLWRLATLRYWDGRFRSFNGKAFAP